MMGGNDLASPLVGNDNFTRQPRQGAPIPHFSR